MLSIHKQVLEVRRKCGKKRKIECILVNIGQLVLDLCLSIQLAQIIKMLLKLLLVHLVLQIF